MALIAIVTLLLSLFLVIRAIRRPQRPIILPPGPPSDPLIGHLRVMPADKQEDIFHEWARLYGDVISLSVPGRSIIILDTVQAAVELLEKRSKTYSDRPRFVVFELMGWTPTLTFLPYGKRFHKHRKLFLQYLAPNSCIALYPLVTEEARALVDNLKAHPEHHGKLLSRYTTSIAMRITYGHRVVSDDDKYSKIIDNVGFAMNNCGPPGSTLVDLFPFLQHLPSWFPGAYHVGYAQEWRWAIRELHDLPFNDVRDQIASGSAKPSFLSHHFEKLLAEGESSSSSDALEDIKYTAGVIYAAGAETTLSTLNWFLLAMILYPECQKRAQNEINAVIGHNRLPELDDHARLPYVECVMQEVLRWRPPLPLGVPHRTMEDDVYRGMFIPKNSLVFANAKGMGLDANIYKDPHKFNPARFLGPNAEPHPIAAFGFGRRICPGRHLANAAVWIAIASILASFRIDRAVGEDGKEIIPSDESSTGLTSQPKPYKLIGAEGVVLSPSSTEFLRLRDLSVSSGFVASEEDREVSEGWGDEVDNKALGGVVPKQSKRKTCVQNSMKTEGSYETSLRERAFAMQYLEDKAQVFVWTS